MTARSSPVREAHHRRKADHSAAWLEAEKARIAAEYLDTRNSISTEWKRATREIEASKTQAIREIYDQTAELATTVAEKILRRNLNVDDQRDLVTRSLDQMQEISKN